MSRNSEILGEARSMSKRSLWYLCHEILGYKDWDKIHDDLELFMHRPAKRKLVLLPRGHLKSSIITKAGAIQTLLKNPNARVLIANQVWDKAREMLYEVKEFLTTKSVLPQLYDQFRSERWNADEIVIKQRNKALSAPSIGTTGVETEMTSTHYDKIYMDDLQGLQNCQTKEQRHKVKRFYRSLVDLLEPGGEMVVVGTRWHQDDLYAEIMEKETDYYDIMVRRVIEKGKLIFPNKFQKKFDPVVRDWVPSKTTCYDYIDYLKKSKGAEYYAQYENNPLDEENQIFKKGYFTYWRRRPEKIYVGMTIDLAMTQKEESDYSVVNISAMDKDYNIYVLDYLRGKWTPSDIVKNIFDMQEKWKPDVIGMETMGFQKALKYACEEEMRKRGVYFPIEDLKDAKHANAKELRIKSLEPLYRDNKIQHAEWMRDKDLEDELLSFPKGRHDDLIDSLSMQLQILTAGDGHRPQEIPYGSYEYWARKADSNNYGLRDYFNYG